jgi:hypothetical protein
MFVYMEACFVPSCFLETGIYATIIILATITTRIIIIIIIIDPPCPVEREVNIYSYTGPVLWDLTLFHRKGLALR